MRLRKRGMEQSLFIIVAAALALTILVIMILVSSKGIGGPFSKIFSIGEQAGSRSDFCQDVNDQDLCENYNTLKCSEAGYTCISDSERKSDANKETSYICIGQRECGDGTSCCTIRSGSTALS